MYKFENLNQVLIRMSKELIEISINMFNFKRKKKQNNNFKIVKIEITYPNYFIDKEIVDINVPIGLSLQEENNYIDFIVENCYSYK